VVEFSFRIPYDGVFGFSKSDWQTCDLLCQRKLRVYLNQVSNYQGIFQVLLRLAVVVFVVGWMVTGMLNQTWT